MNTDTVNSPVCFVNACLVALGATQSFIELISLNHHAHGSVLSTIRSLLHLLASNRIVPLRDIKCLRDQWYESANITEKNNEQQVMITFLNLSKDAFEFLGFILEQKESLYRSSIKEIFTCVHEVEKEMIRDTLYISICENIDNVQITVAEHLGVENRGGYYDSSGESQFTKPYSEETARVIDEEVSKIIEKAYEKAKDLLFQNKEKLDNLAKKLLEREVIFKDDLLEVLGERPWGERNVETQPIAE